MKETILPHELPDALDRAPAGIKVLSLDCFDTLLWRDCHAATDVFAGLSAVNPGQRIIAEKHARKAELILNRSSEVSIEAIYEQAMPSACAAERKAAIADELVVEARACFAFSPTVELMREAKARGLAVIIVSDTYLSAKQLTQLIREAAGEEVAALIDRVIVSSEAGHSKSQGLLAKAIKKVKCKPSQVLHIGDNKAADYDGARALGIPALHLAQFNQCVSQHLRFERSCQQLVGEQRGEDAPAIRALMPHRALLASQVPQTPDQAELLGLTVLGPVFHAFDQWLRREAESLSQVCNGKVHWLFMLRDGHLPHIVHQVGGEAASTARVEVSRFVAIAASLASREAYIKQMALEADLNPATLARQMLFDDSEVERIVGEPKSDQELSAASRRLHTELRSGKRQKLTRRRARERSARLIAHVKAAVDPKPGDVLMLVDLGYNGSAQDRVDTILAEAFNVHVAGRYLLLREMAVSGLDKKGLFDARHYDLELLEAMCGNVAVIEQLATCEIGSVVDFTDEGEPIRKQSAVKGAQSAVRDRVQAGVRRFAEAAIHPPVLRCSNEHAERGWRETAMAALTRFMFLPHADELAVLKSFEHDVNLGSERMVALFDPDHAREGMRRRGLFYMKGSSRMFLPAELASEDLATRLSLLVQNRFGIGLTAFDSATSDIAIPAIFLSGDDGTRSLIEAKSTHEGFYVARLPLAHGIKGIALAVGSVFDWFELGSVTVSPISALGGGASNDEAPQDAPIQFDGINGHAGGLMECASSAATVLVMPPALRESAEPHMVEIVMRPIRRRAVTGTASGSPEKHGETRTEQTASSLGVLSSANLKDAAA
ncbi:MAG: HAD family hydrolase [Pseudomonadota bacterium]